MQGNESPPIQLNFVGCSKVQQAWNDFTATVSKNKVEFNTDQLKFCSFGIYCWFY